jgi:hypothetical protein
VIWAELDIEYLDCLECCVTCTLPMIADVLLEAWNHSAMDLNRLLPYATLLTLSKPFVFGVTQP